MTKAELIQRLQDLGVRESLSKLNRKSKSALQEQLDFAENELKELEDRLKAKSNERFTFSIKQGVLLVGIIVLGIGAYLVL